MKTISSSDFEKVVENVHNNIPYGFDSNEARIYGVFILENNEIQYEQIGSSPDIYDLIFDLTNNPDEIKSYDMFTIGTCGWAAPIKDDEDTDEMMAPSRHPERRRVRLLSNTHSTGLVGSSIQFQDDIDSPVFDYGDAKGALQEAILELFNKAFK